jgi:hypothetical protein
MNVQIELNTDQAWALAQFLKRVGYSDYRSLAADADEAYEMVDAGEQVRKALAESGIAPR